MGRTAMPPAARKSLPDNGLSHPGLLQAGAPVCASIKPGLLHDNGTIADIDMSDTTCLHAQIGYVLTHVAACRMCGAEEVHARGSGGMAAAGKPVSPAQASLPDHKALSDLPSGTPHT